MLERRAVEHDVDALACAKQPVAVADVADEEAEIGPPGVALTLIELIGLVTTEDATTAG